MLTALLTGIKWIGSNLKVAAIFIGLAGAFIIKMLLGTIKKQKHEIEIKDARHEQREEQDVAIAENKQEEKEANEEFRENIIDSDSNDDWDKL